MESSKSYVPSAANGKWKVSFPQIDQEKITSIARARSVHTKLPANQTNRRKRLLERICDMRIVIGLLMG